MADADAVARELVRDAVAPDVATGCAAQTPAGSRVELGGATGTYFDLASLTKPMTAVALARSGLALSTPLRDALPELRDTACAEVTLEMLLSHRAGLPAHIPLHLPLLTGDVVHPARALRRIAESREGPLREHPPLYSDLGYILLGAALARRAGTSDAGAAIEALVVGPLGLARELGTVRSLTAHGVDLASRAAPTEEAVWRGGVVRGQVHDENAWALTGTGGAGHAGMFGTVGAVVAFGCAVLEGLEGTGPFADARVEQLTRQRPGGTLLAGFDGKSEEGSSAGESFGRRAFGHLGFTGTSLWIDPDAGVVVVLLTNRVHPSRENTAIRAARPRAHEALFQRALSLRSARGPHAFERR